MRKQLKAVSTEGALVRVLEALQQELVDASDEEVRAAACELGMSLEMRESAAFAGLTYPARLQLSDFFELETFRQMRLADARAGTQALKRQRPTLTRGRRRKKRNEPDR